MQDVIAIVVSIAATVWLARSLSKRFFAAPCQPPVPGGGDGFVSIDSLTKPKRPLAVAAAPEAGHGTAQQKTGASK